MAEAFPDLPHRIPTRLIPSEALLERRALSAMWFDLKVR